MKISVIFSSKELFETFHITLKIIESIHEKINPYYMDKLWNLNRPNTPEIFRIKKRTI